MQAKWCPEPEADNSALAALVMLLRFHGIGAEADQIRHRIGAP